jgi:protoporphyrin/coproporphyrin ferrochelatase
MAQEHEAVLLIGFGGPNSLADLRPFLANVLRGRPAPPQRIEEVVRHYEILGGRSPYNELTLRQAEALRQLLRGEGAALPVFVGMRNWHPYLDETLALMRQSGIRRALGFILAAQQNDASWERYQRDVAAARESLDGQAPEVDFLPAWHDHPLFIEAMVERVSEALQSRAVADRAALRLVFTAHSIPASLAAASPYVAQLEAQAAKIAARFPGLRYRLAYQSRSGNPRDPWLEPDIGEALREEAARGTRAAVVVPLGFLCDHVEVLYDLDVEAKKIADGLGLPMVRARTVNDHPSFIRMMADVIRAGTTTEKKRVAHR